MSSHDSNLIARMSAARITEVGLPGSTLFNKLDSALADKLQQRAVANSVGHARKECMLLVDAAGSDMLSVIDDLFPKYTRVMYTLYSTFASDIEALRAAVYTALFDDVLTDGEIIHVGGFQDTHAVHGRHVHCEQVVHGPMEYHRAIRRLSVKEQLYRNAAAVKTCMGNKDKLPWDMFQQLTDANHNCPAPQSCTRKAGHMVFDVNVLPMSQQQACFSMVQHDCDVATALLLVEDNSLLGGSGYITASKVRAEYKERDKRIHYLSDDGGVPEFPPIHKDTLMEWLTTTVRHELGCTFYFELVQHYGPFVKIQMTRVRRVLSCKITHRLWDLNAARQHGKVRMVSVPRLRSLDADPNVTTNYVTTQVVVPEKLYHSVHQYALTLQQNDFRRANIRRKLNEMNNRVIVKGTAVEIIEPLHPDVAEVVATELYIKAYMERYDTSQTFKMVTAKMGTAQRNAVCRSGPLTKALGRITHNLQEMWSEAVTDKLREFLDGVIKDRSLVLDVSSDLMLNYSEHTTEIKPGLSVAWLKEALPDCGGYMQALIRDVGSHVEDLQERRTREILGVSPTLTPTDEDRLPGFSRDSADYEGPEVQHHCRDYPHVTSVPDDSVGDDAAERVVVAECARVAEVLNECHVRADTGPDGQVAVMQAQRVEVVMALDDFEQRDRARVDVSDFIEVACDQYQNTFPSVAAADMSADYELAAYGGMAYTVNVPFLRMPMDNIVGSMRMVYESRLNGPNRPNAPSETRNLLTGVVKRNADPNVIKRPQPHCISRTMWENFLDHRCRPEARKMLAEYQKEPIHVALPNVARWAVRVGSAKVDKVVKLFEENHAMMTEYLLNEFLLQFKGKVKPTLSKNAHVAFAKFQTIMHYTTEVNMFWSAMFSDLTARYNALLLPNVHVGVRGNDIDKRDHIRTHHPWGDTDLVYVQLDMSEYDKSQELRAREFFDIMHRELGMSDEYVNMWSAGQRDNVARSMALGMKLIVPLQMKSGIGTTLWGNTAYSQAIAAWLMPNVVYELGQGDDLYDVLASKDFEATSLADKAAAVFNMPLKLISQKVMPSRMGYFCGKFVVYDNFRKEVFMLPDPIKAIESLSRPITEDEAKFDEMYQSFVDRILAWKSDFPTGTFDQMVSRWYEAPDLRVSYLVDALVTAGIDKKTFRTMWEEYLTAVK
nr:putative RNA-dependent RNA polymerase [Wheat associated vipovirus]